jgi:hypothetical protein
MHEADQAAVFQIDQKVELERIPLPQKMRKSSLTGHLVGHLINRKHGQEIGLTKVAQWIVLVQEH